jgi:hypothetical protein
MTHSSFVRRADEPEKSSTPIGSSRRTGAPRRKTWTRYARCE